MSYHPLHVLALLCLILSCCWAEDRIIFQGASRESWRNWRENKLEENADGSFTLPTGRIHLVSKGQFSVGRSGTYRITGEFRAPAHAEVCTYFYLGFIPFTAKGRQIVSTQVCYEPGTETTLFDCVDKGDTWIEVHPSQQPWAPGKYIAFDVESDGADLPNPLVFPYEAIEREVDYWTLTLPSKMPRSFPSGTRVRQHRDAAGYIYAIYAKVGREWKTFSRTITGIARHGTPHDQWWKGTHQVSVLVMKLKTAEDGPLEFRNIRFTEIEKGEL